MSRPACASPIERAAVCARRFEPGRREIEAAPLLAERLAATEAARIPACPVLTPAEALAAENVSDYFELMPFDDAAEPLPIATANIRTRAFSAFGVKPAPQLGADTDTILQALGIDPQDIVALRQQGIV